MKRNVFITFLLLLTIEVYSNDWGRTGHRTVAQIATEYLNEDTLETINKILEGESLVSVSVYADNLISFAEYDEFKPWHFTNYPLDKKYNDVTPKKEGDVVQAINKCIDVLKNPKSSKADKALYLKLLIHFVGDIHQPFHVGRAEDFGGNKIKINWSGGKASLHSIWDSEMIKVYNMSYSELTKDIISIYEYKNEMKNPKYSSLDPVVWADESHSDAKKLYANIPPAKATNINFSYTFKNFPLVKQKLYLAGVRLANLLNNIFSES